MATAGDTVENPVTGERVVFLQTADQTGGELLAIDVFMAPAAHVAAAHVHPAQEERFTIRSGTVQMSVAGRTRTATPGEQITVAAGIPHSWWNDGLDEAQALVEFRPALDTETFFETFFGLARDGKTNRKGMPNLLRLAVIAHEFGDSAPVLPRPALAVQRGAARLLAPLGRLVGYRAIYRRHSPQHPSLS